MKKLTFNEFQHIMAYNTSANETCIEIEFSIDNHTEYSAANLGKTVDIKTNEIIYWFGLTEDGSQAYEFDTFEKFSSAKIFQGESIRDIWDLVSFYSIDACEVEERLPFYFSKNGNRD